MKRKPPNDILYVAMMLHSEPETNVGPIGLMKGMAGMLYVYNSIEELEAAEEKDAKYHAIRKS
jgi:hypothetical protein